LSKSRVLAEETFWNFKFYVKLLSAQENMYAIKNSKLYKEF